MAHGHPSESIRLATLLALHYTTVVCSDIAVTSKKSETRNKTPLSLLNHSSLAGWTSTKLLAAFKQITTTLLSRRSGTHPESLIDCRLRKELRERQHLATEPL